MATSKAPTIIDLKSSFIRQQILLLSYPLAPSAAFTQRSETTLRPKAIDDALTKLNLQLKRHNKLAYGPQAQRHVAEQIDRLYWTSASALLSEGCGLGWSSDGSDYLDDDVIHALPVDAYGESNNGEVLPPDLARRYRDARSRLVMASQRRKKLRARLDTCRALSRMIALFDEHVTLQQNLLTRDGELERELESMRRLMVRVERGLGGLEGRTIAGDGNGESDEVDGEGEEEDKLLALLI